MQLLLSLCRVPEKNELALRNEKPNVVEMYVYNRLFH